MTTDTPTKIKQSAELTQKMRDHQDKITELGAQRRKLLMELWESGVPQTTLAEANDVTTQSIYMELRKERESKRELIK
tara:strand:+ start:203 stop:436 length:234 start_codon:yes stop_codon:yes gene_type:complete